MMNRFFAWGMGLSWAFSSAAWGCQATHCFYEATYQVGGSKTLVANFQGTLQAQPNALAGQPVQTLGEGALHDLRNERLFKGQFIYAPLASSVEGKKGYYIFQGTRSDADGSEPVVGLFVSSVNSFGTPSVFQRARPDYLAKIRSEQSHSAEAATTPTSADGDNRHFFGAMLGMVGGILAARSGALDNAMGGGGTPLPGWAALSQSSFGLLGDSLQPQGSAAGSFATMLQVVQAVRGGEDSPLGQILGTSRDAVSIVETLSAAGNSDGQIFAQGAVQLLGKVMQKEGAPALPVLGGEGYGGKGTGDTGHSMPVSSYRPAGDFPPSAAVPSAIVPAAPPAGSAMPRSSYVPK